MPARVGIIFGPVPLVRRMVLAAVLSLLLVMGLALFPEVTGDISFANALERPLFLNLMFLLSAAALGASFAVLYKVNRYIAEANYDPKFEASYWIRFTLGLIAGTILAELIPVGELQAATENAAAMQGNDQHPVTDPDRLTKPLLALLGGFSAAVLFHILNRFVTAVDTLVRGETREIFAAQEQAAHSRMATVSRLVALH